MSNILFYILIYINYLYDYIIFNDNNLYSNNLINLIFLLLTTFIYPIIALLIKNNTNMENITNKINIENMLLLILFFILTWLFASNNLFQFYIYFELTLIILLLLIILFGYKYKKYDAFYKFWIYSIIGSIPLFIIIIYFYSILGSLNNNILELYINYSNIKYIVFLLIILSLIIKLPSFPFHNWLTLAHVEANTIGSIILAGIILKISIYGIIKYNLIILYSIFQYLSPIFIFLSICSIIIISHYIINQIDFKLIIAYSSIIHTNYMFLGLLSYNYIGIYGSLISSISHTFISSGLFLCIGILYNRYKTRILLYYKGLSEVMVIFSIIYFIFIISNVSIPLTSNFIGELCIYIGYFNNNIILILILLFYLLLTTTYNFIILNKVIYGKLSIYIKKYHDLTYKEFILLGWLLIINILFGINPPLL